mmetsp:Transcript_10011/g.30570  ORF Transcript_10011/g.30570 Transcript_10011/m.30570 type:complete len:661 (+) Transcript_10011:334-2316(+)|eukprot:CAMPEP_0198727346 /NCGR_PEP_ID=MMETSP1475-20131203/4104_1 /TAXON_ID= ORGANISM="Unidentified sp., Strain CCMP1999" /NCGR_SAMPLE_ID=MMETSP1475 /ASSEMBLY_ACC=CAM_ASM_001111 /LENGTH=660 /DNA_ID=CAMNT_0044489375 /DNA_START=350 /DNA_END=2332 /DNA_ORIENTATION=-
MVKEEKDNGSLPSLVTGTKPNHVTTAKTKAISFDELAKHFHMPINDAAKELGICATVLKELCRRRGIQRWPHRKLKALDRLIEKYEHEQSSAVDQGYYQNEIRTLKQKKESVLRHYSRHNTADPPSPTQEQPAPPPPPQRPLPEQMYGVDGMANPSARLGAPRVYHQYSSGGEPNPYGKCTACEAGDPHYMHPHFYEPHGVMQMRRMDYHPAGAVPLGQHHPGPPEGTPQGTQQVNAMQHTHHGPPQASSMYAMNMQGRGASGASQCMACPPGPHPFMHGMPGSTAQAGPMPYHQMSYGPVMYDAERGQYPYMPGYPMGAPQAVPDRAGMAAIGSNSLSGQPHETGAIWQQPHDGNDEQTREKRRVADNQIEKRAWNDQDGSGDQGAKNLPAMTATIATRKGPQETSHAAKDAMPPHERRNGTKEHKSQHQHTNSKSGKMKVTELIQNGAKSDKNAANDTESHDSNSMEEVMDTDQTTLRDTNKSNRASSSDAAPYSFARKIGDGIFRRANELEAPREATETDDPPSSRAPLGESQYSKTQANQDFILAEVLCSLQATVWTMNTDTTCTSRNGPDIVAFHGDVPSVGEKITEQVNRKAGNNKDMAAKLLEPYMQARSGVSVERTFWHNGRKFLQIFSPMNDERRQSHFTSSLCVELNTSQ